MYGRPISGKDMHAITFVGMLWLVGILGLPLATMFTVTQESERQRLYEQVQSRAELNTLPETQPEEWQRVYEILGRTYTDTSNARRDLTTQDLQRFLNYRDSLSASR